MFFMAKILLLTGFASIGVLGQLEPEPEFETLIAEVGTSITIPVDYTLIEDEILFSLLWKHESDNVAMLSSRDQVYPPKYQGRALVREDYSLMLSDLTLADSGEYQYSFVTSKGSVEKSRTLKVLASPTVSAQPTAALDTGSGKNQELAMCYAVGGSMPYTIGWYDGDKPVPNSQSRIDSANAENELLVDSTLALSTVANAAEDNGRILTCVVNDAFGRRIERQVTLQVSEPTTTVPTTTMQAFPEIIRFPHSSVIALVLGRKRALNCEATGVPKPKVTWFKDNVPLKSGMGECRLEVIAGSYSDTGVYMCEASNKEGRRNKEVAIDVQGSPVISDIEKFPNNTEEVFLKADDDFVRLMCESNANPRPDFEWRVQGVNLTDLEMSHHVIKTEDGSSAYINISARHFRGSESKTKVTCVANNFHGVAKKDFVVTVPVLSSSTGMIVGIVVALLVLILLLVAVGYFVLVKRHQGTMTTSPESGGLGLWPACCGGAKTVKSKELKEEDDVVTVEHVKEVSEEGTHEEKRKLTEAEEKPAKEDEKKDVEETGEAAEEDNTETQKETPKKAKSKVKLPMQCCRGKKKKSGEKKAEGEEEVEKDVEEEQNKKAENGDTKEAASADEKKERRENDRDSGKGDTLEKVIEEEAAEK